MMYAEIIFIFVVLFIGSFMQGASGFGFGLFAMSFLPFIFTLKDSALLVIVLSLITAASILVKLMKYIEWKGLIYILSAALTGRVAAFFVLHNFGEMDALKRMLGFVLLGMVVYIFKKKKPLKSSAIPPVLPLSLGFLGGFIGGVFVVGGPFFVFYFLLAFQDKYAYTANLQAVFAVTSVLTVIMHWVSGDFSASFPLYFLIGMISVLIGTRIGMRWMGKISQDQVRKLAGVIVAASAINIIVFT
ncbi:sulfite exporter TauE/SafE family protein [Alteribacillus sp. HJP-4]|uniref:sulfite exporter TauE/SafE family protein n=1 Tax=Alteribacillus sp. HJP-4 TaxID=2775394 RepID=UPI0035CD3247